MPVLFKVKRGTKAAIQNTTLQEGEIVVSTDTKELYYSDGSAKHLIGGNTFVRLTATSQTITGDLTVNGVLATSNTVPTNDNHVATKYYVDSLAQGLKPKQSVRVATTTNLTYTWSNGEFTGVTTAPTIDGVTLSNGDRILVWQQTNAYQNGIYYYDASAQKLKRTPDADTWDELVSAYLFVEEGNTYSDVGFVCTVNRGGTLNTTNVTFVIFTGAASIEAGLGLTKTGNTIDVGAGNGISVSDDSVEVKLDSTPGLEFGTGGGLRVKVNTAAGLKLDASGVGVDIASTNPGLQFSGGKLAVKANTTNGIDVDSNGIKVKLGNGLQFDGSGNVTVKAGTAISVDANGVSVIFGTTSGTACAGNDSRLHNQNTDVGTSSTSFYIGTTNSVFLRNASGDLEIANASSGGSYRAVVAGSVKVAGTSFSGTISLGTLTANRAYTLPDVSGTILTDNSIIDCGTIS